MKKPADIGRTIQKNPRLWPERSIPSVRCLLLLVLLVHTTGLVGLFDPVSGVVNTDPVIEQDWCPHYHYVKSLEGFWAEGHRIWGYNPYFMAGYNSNTIQDMSVKLLGFLALFSPGMDIIQAFKIWTVLLTGLIPLLLYWTALNFFHTSKNAGTIGILAALLGTMHWWNSLPREMFFYGQDGFPIGCYFSILTVSLVYRLLSEKTVPGKTAPALAVLIIILPAMHLLCALMVVVSCLPVMVIMRNRLRPGTIIVILAGIAASAILNRPWLYPFILHLDQSVSGQIVDRLPIFCSHDPLTFLKDYFTATGYWSFRTSVLEKGFRIMLLISGITGVFKLYNDDKKELSLILTTIIFMFFLLVYFGSLAPPLKGFQPLRYKVFLNIILLFPAAFFIPSVFSGQARNPLKIFFPALLVFGTTAFLVNLYQTESAGAMRLRTSLSPDMSRLLNRIKTSTTTDARILFEESGDETGHIYDGMYFSSLIAHMADRELIGGPVNLYNDIHHFAGFYSGHLFKRDIREFTPDALDACFKTYNIGYIICFHPDSLRALSRLNGRLIPDFRQGPFYGFKVSRQPDWFLKGQGHVHATLNHIECRNVRGEQVVLKYHWNRYLVADDPSIRLKPVSISDNPIPFIKIDHPPEQFTIQINKR